MSYPRVILIDGPSGVGKSYFISKIEEGLALRYPQLKVKTLKATDFVLKGDARSELRKYVIHDTEQHKLKGIFRGHLDLIDYIVKELYKEDPTDVILVDRSFLTFLCVNVWKTEDKVKREIYSEQYNSYFSTKLGDTETLFIKLGTGTTDPRRTVNILLSSIASRDDGKQVDMEWMYSLVRSYSLYPSLINDSCTNYEELTSAESEYVLLKYYK